MKNINKLNPNWVTGFVDAEGCFYIRMVQSNACKNRWLIQPCFQIQLHSKDVNLLILLKFYFNEVGNIYYSKNKKLCIYQVRGLTNINNVILPHFIKYPLLTRKYHDFIMFKSIITLVKNKEHLNEKGFMQILELKDSLNKGLKPKIKKIFSNITLVKRHVANIPEKLNPD